MLVYKGKIDGKRTSTYQGRERAYLQFVMPDETGALKFLEVKVPDNMDHNRFKIGAMAEFPVDYSLVNGEIYFKVSEKVSPDEIKVSQAK